MKKKVYREKYYSVAEEKSERPVVEKVYDTNNSETMEEKPRRRGRRRKND